MADNTGESRNKAVMDEAVPTVPDYLASPNAVFTDEGVQWRYGRAPDYSKTRKVWEEGKHEPLSCLNRRQQQFETELNVSYGRRQLHNTPCLTPYASTEAILKMFLVRFSICILLLAVVQSLIRCSNTATNRIRL